MKHLEVAAGIIVSDGKVLCAQRGAGRYAYLTGKFEFPGGKIEAGELPEEALVRELDEELGISATVRPGGPLCIVDHEYPDFSVTMHAFVVSGFTGVPEFREHTSAVWLRPDEMPALDWAPADLPVVAEVRRQLLK